MHFNLRKENKHSELCMQLESIWRKAAHLVATRGSVSVLCCNCPNSTAVWHHEAEGHPCLMKILHEGSCSCRDRSEAILRAEQSDCLGSSIGVVRILLWAR